MRRLEGGEKKHVGRGTGERGAVLAPLIAERERAARGDDEGDVAAADFGGRGRLPQDHGGDSRPLAVDESAWCEDKRE